MLPILLRIATIYLVACFGILVGIGISSDVRRWLRKRPHHARQSGTQRLKSVVGVRHV